MFRLKTSKSRGAVSRKSRISRYEFAGSPSLMFFHVLSYANPTV